MHCAICRNGETAKGVTTVVLERNGNVIVLRNVPAEICDNCGEYYLDEETTADVMERAEDALSKGAEVEILRYAA